MRARTQIEREQLYRMMEQTLIPPATVTELDPDPIHAATARLGDVMGNPSERYQLDSMLTDAEYKRLPTRDEVQHIREYYYTTTAEGYDRLSGQASRLVRQWRQDDVLAPVLSPAWTDPASVAAMFAVDALVAVDSAFWRQVPGRNGLIFDQHISDTQLDLLLKATVPAMKPESLESSIFIVGAFARASYVYGKRTYRSVAMAAGILANSIMQSARRNQMIAGILDQFVDFRVNSALANDGLDRGVVAVVNVRKPPQRAGATLAPEGDPNQAAGDGRGPAPGNGPHGE